MLYNKIKAISKEMGIPICKIEEECGFARGSISKWKDVSPSWDKVKKVSALLKVPIEEFVEE